MCKYRMEQARESRKASQIMLENKMIKDSIGFNGRESDYGD